MLLLVLFALNIFSVHAESADKNVLEYKNIDVVMEYVLKLIKEREGRQELPRPAPKKRSRSTSPDAEVVACMTDDRLRSYFVSDGYSWLCQYNPGYIQQGGLFYGTQKYTAALFEFEGMFQAITECAKAGDMTPITSGKYKWFAPSGRPLYNIYTQKAGTLEEYGRFEERVMIVGNWVNLIATDQTYCPNKLSAAAHNKFLALMQNAYDLWQKEFDYYPSSIPPPIVSAPGLGGLAYSIASTSSPPAVIQMFGAVGLAFLCYGSFRYYVK